MRFHPILNTVFSKFSWGAKPRTPLEGLEKFFLAAAWLKNLFQDRLPPPPGQTKILDRTLQHSSIGRQLLCHLTACQLSYQAMSHNIKYSNACQKYLSVLNGLVNSFSFKLRMIASCMNHVCIMNVSQMYHVFDILTETMDERERLSIKLFEK